MAGRAGAQASTFNNRPQIMLGDEVVRRAHLAVSLSQRKGLPIPVHALPAGMLLLPAQRRYQDHDLPPAPGENFYVLLPGT
jgi:hypothetical protein